MADGMATAAKRFVCPECEAKVGDPCEVQKLRMGELHIIHTARLNLALQQAEADGWRDSAMDVAKELADQTLKPVFVGPRGQVQVFPLQSNGSRRIVGWDNQFFEMNPERMGEK